jgi:hypothetical protein
MTSPLYRSALTATLLIAPLACCFGGSTVAQAEGQGPLSFDPVRPGNWDCRTESSLGYLKVYSATDEFNDGAALYFPHSSYAIYTIDGKFVRNVKNRRFAGDEIPEAVTLPVGIYTVHARSMRRGYIRSLVLIKEAQQTVLHLDTWETTTPARLAHN